MMVNAGVAIADINDPEDLQTIYLFYSEDCQFCQREKAWLNSLVGKRADLRVQYYEVHENEELTKKVRKALDIENGYIPLTVVGSDYFIGYNESIGEDILDALSHYKGKDFCDLVPLVLEGKSTSGCRIKNDGIYTNSNWREFPFLGEARLKDVVLPILAIVLGILDAFNPMLLGILGLVSLAFGKLEKKGRRIAFMITFFVALTFSTFLFMECWTIVATMFANRNFLYLLAGILLLLALYQLSRFFRLRKKESSYEVLSSHRKEKLQQKLEKLTEEKTLSYALTLLFVFTLFLGVLNLLGSTGLSLVYTQLLTMNELSMMKSWLSIGLYLLGFLLTVFLLFLKVRKGENQKKRKGGIVCLLVAIFFLVVAVLWIVKPALVLFNF